jgi:hypothetical protein
LAQGSGVDVFAGEDAVATRKVFLLKFGGRRDDGGVEGGVMRCLGESAVVVLEGKDLAIT